MKKTVLALGMTLIVLAACQPSPSPMPTATPTLPPPTATPTPLSPRPTVTPTSTPMPPPSGPGSPTPTGSPICDGLDGEIEVRVLVGPAEAVGLEPFAVGNIPFAVTTGEEPYVVQGGGPISYADILIEEWGMYEVTLNLETTIAGECTEGASGEELHMILDMTGEQMVEVTAEGFHGEYPWTGAVSFDLSFPLVEGATAQGEGWAFILHPHSR